MPEPPKRLVIEGRPVMASVGLPENADNWHAEALVKMLHEAVANLRQSPHSR
jgi:hypothetical protein